MSEFPSLNKCKTNNSIETKLFLESECWVFFENEVTESIKRNHIFCRAKMFGVNSVSDMSADNRKTEHPIF